MLGRELDARITKAAGHQIHKGVMGLGQVLVHRIHHLLRGVGAGHGQHAGVYFGDHGAAAFLASLGSQAASHDHLAIGSQCFANGVQTFLDGIVNKTAGVHDHQIRAFKGFGGLVALSAELREDEFRVSQCLGAAQRHKAHLGGAVFGCHCVNACGDCA